MEDRGQYQNSPGQNEDVAHGKISKYLGMVRISPYDSPPSGSDSENQSRNSKKSPDERIADFTGQLSIWTGALVVISAISAGISYCTLSAINGQLSEMRDEQRAWLYVTQSIDGPIVESTDVTDVSVAFKVENVGKSPALDVDLEYEAVPVSFHHAGEKIEDFAFCKYDDDIPTGVWIPPGGFHEYKNRIFMVANGLIAKESAKDEKGRFWIYVTGCVNYHSGKDLEFHRTPIYFGMYRWVPEFPHGKTSFVFDAKKIYEADTLRISTFDSPDKGPN